MNLYQHLEVAQFTLDVKIMNPCTRRRQKLGAHAGGREREKEGRNEARETSREEERKNGGGKR